MNHRKIKISHQKARSRLTGFCYNWMKRDCTYTCFAQAKWVKRGTIMRLGYGSEIGWYIQKD